MEEIRYLISDASKKVNVETHVLRYWEEELGISIPRNEMGHRYYTEFHIHLFRQVKQLKDRGYQLKAIKTALQHVMAQDQEFMQAADVLEKDMARTLQENQPSFKMKDKTLPKGIMRLADYNRLEGSEPGNIRMGFHKGDASWNGDIELLDKRDFIFIKEKERAVRKDEIIKKTEAAEAVLDMTIKNTTKSTGKHGIKSKTGKEIEHREEVKNIEKIYNKQEIKEKDGQTEMKKKGKNRKKPSAWERRNGIVGKEGESNADNNERKNKQWKSELEELIAERERRELRAQHLGQQNYHQTEDHQQTDGFQAELSEQQDVFPIETNQQTGVFPAEDHQQPNGFQAESCKQQDGLPAESSDQPNGFSMKTSDEPNGFSMKTSDEPNGFSMKTRGQQDGFPVQNNEYQKYMLGWEAIQNAQNEEEMKNSIREEEIREEEIKKEELKREAAKKKEVPCKSLEEEKFLESAAIQEIAKSRQSSEVQRTLNSSESAERLSSSESAKITNITKPLTTENSTKPEHCSEGFTEAAQSTGLLSMGFSALPQKQENSSVVMGGQDEKMQKFQDIMNHIIGHALELNNEKLSHQISEQINEQLAKDLEEVIRVRDEREEERFRQLDETIRSCQRDSQGKAEAAAARIPFFRKRQSKKNRHSQSF